MEQVIFGICLVDFHHKRGPEVEYWYGLPEGISKDGLWPDLPFQALPDGSHSFEETFTCFTLLYNKKNQTSLPHDVTQIFEDDMSDYTTLFAISCSRQINSDDLLVKDESVTRSTVQKAIVVISYQPIFGQLRDKLSIVTNVFFMQHDFTDKSIINTLYDSLLSIYDPASFAELSQNTDNSNIYMGISLRNILLTFKKDMLVLLKALLLEKKIIVYGTHVDALCNLQFGLISLVPDLIFYLKDSISPGLYDKPILEKGHIIDSFKSSDKKSVYKFLGLPLRVFEKGGLFSPYTPLQQIDNIKSDKTKFFMIGTSNSLLYEQRTQLCDVFVNMDEKIVEIINKDLNPLLNLSHHDKKWIDSMLDVMDTSDTADLTRSDILNNDPSSRDKQSDTTVTTQPISKMSSISYEGSDDFLRGQFEEYLIGLLSSVKLHGYINANEGNEMVMESLTEEMIKNKPILTYNFNWVKAWILTQNYQIFNNCTDDRIFDLFPPRHVYTGVDPFTLFQQRFLNTFQNLKKNTSSISKESVNSENPDNTSFIATMTANDDKKSEAISTNTSKENEPSQTQQVNNVWNNWKEYFKKDKGEEEKPLQQDEDSSELSTSSSTTHDENKNIKNVFENALLGLGIRIEKKSDDSPMDHRIEKKSDDSPMDHRIEKKSDDAPMGNVVESNVVNVDTDTNSNNSHQSSTNSILDGYRD